jgi:hypothetical protein
MLRLLAHQWKEKIRTPFWQKSIWLNIVLGIMAIYLLLNIVLIGFFADKIIHEIYKNTEVIEAFTGFLFFYFAIDLSVRFLFQQLPTLSIQPYLTLPIKKRILLHYPLIKSVSSFFNIAAILLILPFFVKVVCSTKTLPFSLAWIITIFSFIFTNNFLNFSLKKYFSKRPLLILFLFGSIGTLLYFDLAKTAVFSGYFANAILLISQKPWLTVIPISIALISYFLGYYLLKKNSYIEDYQLIQHRTTGGFSFLNRYGEVGSLIRTEIKLIFRNKRPKSVLYVSLVFLLYGLMFYKEKDLNNYLLLTFIGLLLTSFFALTYSQHLFSWESSFFDSYLCRRISLITYIKSKYIFFAIVSTVGFILILPYALISYKIAFINFALLFYNIGISSIILIYSCTYNTSRIDLGKSQFMNYQGMGITQYLMIIPLFGFPAIVYLTFQSLGLPQYCCYALGIIGIIGIILNKYLLQIVVNQFAKRKYKMSFGFRQN